MISTPKLRDYQRNAVDTIRNKIASGKKRILLVMPTGSGKTNLASEVIKLATNKGKKSLFVAHKRELVYQAHTRLATFGIDAGIIMPPHSANGHSTHVASIQTLIRREHPLADIVFLDECHHASSPSFVRVIENYKDSIIIGLTATPFRMDGKPLGDIFEEVVTPVTIQELIDMGFLVKPRYFGAKIDLAKIKVVRGDYDPSQLFESMDKKFLYDGVVEKFKEFGNGSTIVFCINIEHSRKTTDTFIAAGYKAAHIDFETNNEERKKLLDEFKKGNIQILSNCGIFSEGFDCPDINTVILNKATKSKGNYFQMIGRALRPIENKTHCIVIDHGNNFYEHGAVEWEQSVDCIKKRKGVGTVEEKEVQAKECNQCKSLLHIQTKTCPYCGYIFTENKIELINAEFSEIDVEKIKPKIVIPAHLRKRWLDMSNEELEEYRLLKGYKPGWKFYVKKKQENNISKV